MAAQRERPHVVANSVGRCAAEHQQPIARRVVDDRHVVAKGWADLSPLAVVRAGRTAQHDAGKNQHRRPPWCHLRPGRLPGPIVIREHESSLPAPWAQWRELYARSAPNPALRATAGHDNLPPSPEW